VGDLDCASKPTKVGTTCIGKGNQRAGVSRLIAGVLILTALRAVAAAPALETVAPLPIPIDPARIERLRSHRVDVKPEGLTTFLENGFSTGVKLNGLPTTPVLKTRLAIDAMIELSRRQVRQAVPALVTLACGTPTPGVRMLILLDMDQARAGEQLRLRDELLRMLRLNAIVALGLIGGDHAGELIRIFNELQDPGLKAAVALALATQDSDAGIGYLVEQTRSGDREIAVAAGQSLNYITGLGYGPSADDPIARRKEAADQWKAWWKKSRGRFRPVRQNVLAWRLRQPARPAPREPQTVRDLLDAVVYPEDNRWTLDGYMAYERLRQMGENTYKECERIMADKKENLLIRRQAILLYTQMALLAAGRDVKNSPDARKAYRLIRHLRWDKNPEIRQVVEKCLAQLGGE